MDKYILVCKGYIFHFRLIIYVLYSFTHSFSTFYIGLLFTHIVAWVNLLSTLIGSLVLEEVEGGRAFFTAVEVAAGHDDVQVTVPHLR